MDRGKGTGVLYYIRNYIQYHRRKDLESPGLEAICIETFIVKPILLCFVYRPPDSSAYSDSVFIVKLQEMLQLTTIENKETILAGDLNCKYLVPNDLKEIKDVLQINGFNQLIQSLTRKTKNTKTLIDVFATTDKTKISKILVHANSFSYHVMISQKLLEICTSKSFLRSQSYLEIFENTKKEAFRYELQNIDGAEVLLAENLTRVYMHAGIYSSKS